MNSVNCGHPHFCIEQHSSEFPGRDFDKSPLILKIFVIAQSILSSAAVYTSLPRFFAITNPHFLVISAVVTFVMSLKLFSSIYRNSIDEMKSIASGGSFI